MSFTEFSTSCFRLAIIPVEVDGLADWGLINRLLLELPDPLDAPSSLGIRDGFVGIEEATTCTNERIHWVVCFAFVLKLLTYVMFIHIFKEFVIINYNGS